MTHSDRAATMHPTVNDWLRLAAAGGGKAPAKQKPRLVGPGQEKADDR
jgi:hypothetical protein